MATLALQLEHQVNPCIKGQISKGKDMHKLYQLLLSPRGRIGRGAFVGGLAILMFLVLGQNRLWPYLGNGLASFFIPMFLFFLTFHISLCIFGKRLHDMGHSLWPFTGLIAFMIVLFLVVMLKYGGLEYFETVMAHPEYADKPEEMRKVSTAYAQALKAGFPHAKLIMAVPPILFTLWLALMPGQKGQNTYG